MEAATATPLTEIDNILAAISAIQSSTVLTTIDSLSDNIDTFETLLVNTETDVTELQTTLNDF